MNLVGRLVGQRYRLEERAGGGGMAVVFRGTDTILDRPVAVKVLRAQYAGDEDFVRRFKREAQAAASLSHSSVVSIYDVGQEDDDIYYIVMELVDGRDLKQKVAQEGPLPVNEAVRITQEILDALDHAHAHGIIHRDIKPSNVLLNRAGRVKVTDFGIARATTTDTLTNTGSILGSAHYFSPEQARGGATGERSDIYSLGVVLYELVTGRVPFAADSPITVALMHVQDSPQPASQINPAVPLELDEIILRALEKDPARRYQSAREMRADLAAFLVDLGAGRVTMPTGDMPTQRIDLSRARRQLELDPDAQQRRRSLWAGWVFWGVVVASVLAGVALAGWTVVRFLHVPEVTVPDVRGLNIPAARTRLEANGLGISVEGEEYSDQVEVNMIVRQTEEPGMIVKQGRVVGVFISRGRKQVEVPRLVELMRYDAEETLKRAGLAIGKVSEEYSSEFGEGRVMRQSPAPRAVVVEGALVDLVISRGALAVPNLIGKKRADLDELLKKTGLVLGEVTYQESTEAKDTVVDQTPKPPAEVPTGTRINVVLSQGQTAVTPSETYVAVRVPQGPFGTTARVQVVVTDQQNRRTIHDNAHPWGSTFPLVIRWYGKQATVQVLVNGQLHNQISLP